MSKHILLMVKINQHLIINLQINYYTSRYQVTKNITEALQYDICLLYWVFQSTVLDT